MKIEFVSMRPAIARTICAMKEIAIFRTIRLEGIHNLSCLPDFDPPVSAKSLRYRSAAPGSKPPGSSSSSPASSRNDVVPYLEAESSAGNQVFSLYYSRFNWVDAIRFMRRCGYCG